MNRHATLFLCSLLATLAAPVRAQSAQAAPTSTVAGGAIDAQLVGRWFHQSLINSGGGAGGFASFTTERTLDLRADGMVHQWVRSVGGGSSWSSNSARRLEFSGHWVARQGEIWVQPDGQSAYQSAARYRFSGQYLVAESQQGRRIWQR